MKTVSRPLIRSWRFKKSLERLFLKRLETIFYYPSGRGLRPLLRRIDICSRISSRDPCCTYLFSYRSVCCNCPRLGNRLDRNSHYSERDSKKQAASSTTRSWARAAYA